MVLFYLTRPLLLGEAPPLPRPPLLRRGLQPLHAVPLVTPYGLQGTGAFISPRPISYATKLRLSKRLRRPCGIIPWLISHCCRVFTFNLSIFQSSQPLALNLCQSVPICGLKKTSVVWLFLSTDYHRFPQIIKYQRYFDYHRFFRHGNPRLFQRHGFWLRIDISTALRDYGLLRKFTAFFSTEFFCPQISTDYHRLF